MNGIQLYCIYRSVHFWIFSLNKYNLFPSVCVLAVDPCSLGAVSVVVVVFPISSVLYNDQYRLWIIHFTPTCSSNYGDGSRDNGEPFYPFLSSTSSVASVVIACQKTSFESVILKLERAALRVHIFEDAGADNKSFAGNYWNRRRNLEQERRQ